MLIILNISKIEREKTLYMLLGCLYNYGVYNSIIIIIRVIQTGRTICDASSEGGGGLGSNLKSCKKCITGRTICDASILAKVGEG